MCDYGVQANIWVSTNIMEFKFILIRFFNEVKRFFIFLNNKFVTIIFVNIIILSVGCRYYFLLIIIIIWYWVCNGYTWGVPTFYNCFADYLEQKCMYMYIGILLFCKIL